MAPLSDPGTSPTVFETLATTAGYPNARSVGKVMSEPDPTTVLMVPAARPAPKIAIASSGLIGLRAWPGVQCYAVSCSPAQSEASAVVRPPTSVEPNGAPPCASRRPGTGARPGSA